MSDTPRTAAVKSTFAAMMNHAENLERELHAEHLLRAAAERTIARLSVPAEERLPQAQGLLSKMLNITAHWHSSPDDCDKCRTVKAAVEFLQDTGYGVLSPQREPQK